MSCSIRESFDQQVTELLFIFVVLSSVSLIFPHPPFLSVYFLPPPLLHPGFDLRSAQVVSLGTGTKCLDLENMSDHGSTLSDCHAEVISRRALVQFLYAQLELLLWYDPTAPNLKSVFFLLSTNPMVL